MALSHHSRQEFDAKQTLPRLSSFLVEISYGRINYQIPRSPNLVDVAEKRLAMR